MSRSPLERYVFHPRLPWLALALSTPFLAVMFLVIPPVSDFAQYWTAARNVVQGLSPYAHLPVGAYPENVIPYPNPPLLAYLLAPLALLGLPAAEAVFLVFNWLGLFALVRLCLWLGPSERLRRAWPAVWLALIVTSPGQTSLFLGQVSVLLSLLLVGSYALWRRGAEGSGGMAAAVALATHIKLYPGWIGALYALRSPEGRPGGAWRRIGLMLAWGVALLAATWLLGGWGVFQDYLDKVLLNNFYPYAADFNVSLNGFFRRLLTASDYAVPVADAPGLALALIALSSLAVVGLCLAALRAPRTAEADGLVFSLWICGMLLLSPVNGVYNLVIMVLPFACVFGWLERNPNRTLAWLLGLSTLLMMMAVTWGNSFMRDLLHRGWGIILLPLPFYGLLLMFGLLLACLRARPAAD